MTFKEDPVYLELLEFLPWLKSFRRELHQTPELSEMEYKTQKKLASLRVFLCCFAGSNQQSANIAAQFLGIFV